MEERRPDVEFYLFEREKMSDSESESDIGWYVSDVHCRRAIGYLSVKLVEDGHLRPDFKSPLLLELWGEALDKTMNVNEPSPIGPDPTLPHLIIETKDVQI
jgi:hypothetical protein